MTERKAVQQIVQPYLRAMADLHSKGIAHGAIVPHNILFDSQDMTCKLAGKAQAVPQATCSFLHPAHIAMSALQCNKVAYRACSCFTRPRSKVTTLFLA